jgi:DNA-directed RNA polymerase subunit M/transcription elongation factor TFIIS
MCKRIVVKWTQECLYCGNYLYRLKDNRLKCSACHKKISLQKTNKIITLIDAFVENESANAAAKRLKLSYSSVWAYYEEFRYLSAKISEEEYSDKRDEKCEYEEYFYLEKTKKSKREAIFDAHNFLTFDYHGHIYTLLLPSLKKYRSQMLQDSVEDAYLDEFNKFKRISRIIKVSKHYNTIVKFWDYFENAIVIYKGIESEAFIYFLKEFEFKFNHTKEEAKDLLLHHYFKEKQ